MKRLKRWLLRFFIITMVVVVVMVAALSILTNSASDEAMALLESDHVSTSREGLLVEAQSPRAHIVFYQGGLVETEAYLPFASLLASKGFTVYIPNMPLNLAILGQGAFERLKSIYDDGKPWIGVGHSLGGASLGFVVDDALMDGLILLAAYPGSNQDLSSLSMPVLSITATADEVLNHDAFKSARDRLPEHTVYVSIEGGNHAQFGDYGFQRGDGEATIARTYQQEQTATIIQDFIEKILEDD